MSKNVIPAKAGTQGLDQIFRVCCSNCFCEEPLLLNFVESTTGEIQ